MPKVRSLVAAIFLLVLALPFLLVGVIRLLEEALLTHTEQTLIAEAVVIGEVYRRILDPSATAPLEPPAPGQERYQPIVPKVDFERTPILEPSTRGPVVRTSTAPGWQLASLLQRTVVRNLTGTRVLDAEGIVVASTNKTTGYDLSHLPEVRAALEGRYSPVLRRRYSDEPPPPLASLSRAGVVRVSIAVPVFSGARDRLGSGGVIGVVYNNRTPLDIEKAFWLWRDKLVTPAVITIGITLILAVVLTLAISIPLGRLRRSAERVAKGDPDAPIETGRMAPEEIQDLATSIGAMRDQLAKRADYIREFAANAAHELKTPLTSLRGAAELLLEDDEGMTTEQRKRFLSNLREDALRMDGLVGRILDLARIESTRPTRERIDLQAFLEGTVERYQRGGQTLRLAYAGPPEIEVSPDQLDSLLGNLIDNALRHGAGAPVDIDVQASKTGVRIAVRDRGPRLEQSALDRVFERFYSTTRNEGGTGLGLAIVKAIAEAHGGTVTARALDLGAVFEVRLPGLPG